MDAEEATWLTAFHAAMLMSGDEWKSSIAVADATEGAKRPKRVELPQWNMTLVMDEQVSVAFTAPVSSEVLSKVIGEW